MAAAHTPAAPLRPVSWAPASPQSWRCLCFSCVGTTLKSQPPASVGRGVRPPQCAWGRLHPLKLWCGISGRGVGDTHQPHAALGQPGPGTGSVSAISGPPSGRWRRGPPRQGRLRGCGCGGGGSGPPPPSPPPVPFPSRGGGGWTGAERSRAALPARPVPSRPELGQRRGGRGRGRGGAGGGGVGEKHPRPHALSEGLRDGAAGRWRLGWPRWGAGSRLDVPAAAAAAVCSAPEPAGQPRQRG